MRIESLLNMPLSLLADDIIVTLYSSCHEHRNKRCREVVSEYHRRFGRTARKPSVANSVAEYTKIFVETKKELEQNGFLQRIIEALRKNREVVVRNGAGEELLIQQTRDGCYRWKSRGSEGWGCEEHQLVDRIVIHMVLPKQRPV